MIQEIEFKGYKRPMTLNEYRNAHFHVIAKEKREWEKIMAIECKRQKILPMAYAKKVTLIFYFNTRTKRDSDGHATCGKPMLDGLVKAGIFKDDSFDEIGEFSAIRGGYVKGKTYFVLKMEGA
jgi:Holliday junction resolvase RusA-like endonuclease